MRSIQLRWQKPNYTYEDSSVLIMLKQETQVRASFKIHHNFSHCKILEQYGLKHSTSLSFLQKYLHEKLESWTFSSKKERKITTHENGRGSHFKTQ